MKLWEKLSLLGVDEKASYESERKKIYLNIINVVIILILSVAIVFDLINLDNRKFTIGYLGSYFVVALSVFHLVLNAYGYFKLSRNLLFIDIPFFILYYAPLVGDVMPASLFYGPYLPIAFSVVLYFVIDIKKESPKLLLFLVLYFLMSLTFESFARILSTKELQVYDIIRQVYIFYKLAPLLIFIFVNLSLYYAFSLTKTYEDKLIQANDQLEQKSQELQDKNIELIKSNATKTKFFKIIGHDLKNPITVVILFIDMIEAKYKQLSETELLRYINILKDSAQNGLKLLDNLLSWARTQSGQMLFTPSFFNLSNEINENIEFLKNTAEKKDIQLIVNIQEDIEIFADKNMLNTIIRNLISNAVKFTYGRGKITVSVKQTSKFIEISVQDTGKGLSEEELEKLFKIESGFSTEGTNKEMGTGIGLILCKEFIDKHSGKIWAESELEKGSTFYCSFPLLYDKT